MGDEAPWICMDCAARQSEPGRCRSCGEDPLLDARRPETLEVLAADDDTHRSRRQDRVRYAAVPVGVVVTILLAVYVPGMNQVYLSLPFFTGYLVGMALVAFGAIALYNRFFPYRPRFPFASSSPTDSDSR